LSGSTDRNTSGTYGTKGTASASNIPGARNKAISWSDSIGNLYLFGGWGFDTAAVDGHLNDLWKWDGTNWTWLSGSNTISQLGTYGTKGFASSSNVPRSRTNSNSWRDSSGNLYIWGGYIPTGYSTDLWKWDGTNWTWLSGVALFIHWELMAQKVWGVSTIVQVLKMSLQCKLILMKMPICLVALVCLQ
jgi:hypothetical protein